jgi:hypothetical protein
VRGLLDFGLALGAGTALWLAANAADGVREPWDGANFWWFYTAALVLSAALGLVAARHAWALGAVVVFAMSPIMLVNAGMGPLAMIGELVLAVLSLPAMGAAQIGAAIRARFSGDLSK